MGNECGNQIIGSQDSRTCSSVLLNVSIFQCFFHNNPWKINPKAKPQIIIIIMNVLVDDEFSGTILS
jgi:hypothetical protein